MAVGFLAWSGRDDGNASDSMNVGLFSLMGENLYCFFLLLL